MSRKPTESEIKNEMSAIGGNNDYFSARDRLQHRFDEAERALEKLKPAATKRDDVFWAVEPTADEVLHEARQKSLTVETARENLRAKLAADARRLSSFSAEAASEISEALQQAEIAREKAASILAEHEAALSAVTTGIVAVGNVRRKIAVAKSLLVSEDDKRQLAHRAFDYFVSMETGFQSPATTSGFRAMSEDLAFRTVLADHVSTYVQPLENQAAELIKKIRAEASAAKMDLKKAFSLLAAERTQRGEPLLSSEFYTGIF